MTRGSRFAVIVVRLKYMYTSRKPPCMINQYRWLSAILRFWTKASICAGKNAQWREALLADTHPVTYRHAHPCTTYVWLRQQGEGLSPLHLGPTSGGGTLSTQLRSRSLKGQNMTELQKTRNGNMPPCGLPFMAKVCLAFRIEVWGPVVYELPIW